MGHAKLKEKVEFEGLPANPLLTRKRRAALRRRYGHRVDPFRKKPGSLYLPYKVRVALARKLREIDRKGGYTPGYEFLVGAGGLEIEW